MQFTTAFALTVLGLASTTSAHMKVKDPKPFGNPNNSPLLADGSDFPCKFGNGYAADSTAPTVMAPGSNQTLDWIGSAVHGGGSCQIVVTYDKVPTKSSKWKVIHSIQGGCPARNAAGNLGNNADASNPDTYAYTIPSFLPSGLCTIGVTWFNKVGNREMYMNCGPVSLTGGSNKRDEIVDDRAETELATRDQAAFDALPDMFVANIGNGCSTVEGKDLVFPNPGNSVEEDAVNPNLGPPTGNCGTSAPQGQAPPNAASSLAPAVIPSPSPAVFVVPKPSSSAPSAATTSAPASQPDNSNKSPPQNSGSGGALTGKCSPEGQWNCVDGKSFQQCASGLWSAVESLASGTHCTVGQSSTMAISARSGKAKRAVRFSQEHIHRKPRAA